MANPEMHALDEFRLWLPGELNYFARNDGYDKKINRAYRSQDERYSMSGLLGDEWHNHQHLHTGGNRHTDEHAMSAQLQLAKFAAGIFDKASMANWFYMGGEANVGAYVQAADITASQINGAAPWVDSDIDAEAELHKPFRDTIFSEGIADIAAKTSTIDTMRLTGDEPVVEIGELYDQGLTLGGHAVKCYLAYADHYLNPDEYRLPPSQLA